MDRPQMLAPSTSGGTPEWFLSCDWGTSHFRLRQIRCSDLSILSETSSSNGIRSLRQAWEGEQLVDLEGRFAKHFAGQIKQLLADSETEGNLLRVVVSGMASSSVGWQELPYAGVPFSLNGEAVVWKRIPMRLPDGGEAQIFLISGVASDLGMMRGEEMEMIGLFAGNRHPDVAENGVLILPGTHSKHLLLQNRRLVGIRTYMTGEMFDVLTTHSLLRLSVGREGEANSLHTSEASRGFMEGVEQAASGGLLSSLFQVRSRQVLQACSEASNRWFLSGLLVGSELVELRTLDPDARVLISAGEPLLSAYLLAAERLGVLGHVQCTEPGESAQALIRAHASILNRVQLEGGRP